MSTSKCKVSAVCPQLLKHMSVVLNICFSIFGVYTTVKVNLAVSLNRGHLAVVMPAKSDLSYRFLHPAHSAQQPQQCVY